MTRLSKWLLGGLMSGGAILSVGVALGLGTHQSVPHVRSVSEKEDNRPIYVSGIQDRQFFDPLFENLSPQPTTAASAVVPHHLIAGKYLAQLFTDLREQQPETVVILSPNHFDLGKAAIQTGQGKWTTPYGSVATNARAVTKLLTTYPEMQASDDLFAREHGIAALTPFIAHTWPQAAIVPIAMKDGTTPEERQQLADWLAQNLPDALVLASVDMVHESPERVAQSHDEVTEEYLARNCQPASFTPAADAPWVLDTLCRINIARGTEAFTFRSRTSSVSLGLAEQSVDNTSHIIGIYQRGTPKNEPYAALHFVGDIMLDRGTRRAIDAAGTPEYPWQKVQWLLTGTHLRVGNLEGTVNERPSKYTDNPPFEFVFHPSFVEAMKPYIDVVSLANNHAYDVGRVGQEETIQRLTDMGIPYFGSYFSPLPVWKGDVGGMPLALVGYHQFQPAVEELQRAIQEAKAEGRVVIVMPHWGTEYINAPQENQRALARIMIAAGADIIIGGHPHVPQGIEVIDGVPVVYSLGNFVFDQRLPETWQALTVTLQITPEEYRFHFLPTATKNSQPIPLEEAPAAALLKKLSALSGEDIRAAVENGVLSVPRNRVQ